MDVLVLHHGELLAVALVTLLVFAALTVAGAIHVHANASARVPRDPRKFWKE